MSFHKNIHPCNYHIIFSPLCLFKISNVFNSLAKYDLSNWIKAFPERKKERGREAPGLWPCIPAEASPEMGQVDLAFEDSPQLLLEDLFKAEHEPILRVNKPQFREVADTVHYVEGQNQ